MVKTNYEQALLDSKVKVDDLMPKTKIKYDELTDIINGTNDLHASLPDLEEEEKEHVLTDIATAEKTIAALDKKLCFAIKSNGRWKENGEKLSKMSKEKRNLSKKPKSIPVAAAKKILAVPVIPAKEKTETVVKKETPIPADVPPVIEKVEKTETAPVIESPVEVKEDPTDKSKKGNQVLNWCLGIAGGAGAVVTAWGLFTKGKFNNPFKR